MATARGGVTGTPLPWGADHHDAFEASFDHTMGFTISADDLPDMDNRITLSDRLTDRDGCPRPGGTIPSARIPAASWISESPAPRSF